MTTRPTPTVAGGATPPHGATGCPRAVVVLSSPTKTVRVHVRGLVRRLLLAGVDVRLAASRAVLASFADVLDVDVHGTVLPLGEDVRPVHDLAAASTLRAALRNHGTDVVHAHGFRAGAVAALAVRTLRRRPALVTTWHSLPYPGDGGRVALRAGERLVARSSDVTLAPSSDLLRRAEGLGARRARLSPVAAPAARPPAGERADVRAALAAELGLPVDVPWILTVGRIVPQKNHDLLLDASARWRGLHPCPQVLVVGVGPAPVVTRLRRTIAEADLPVHLLGARDDIAALMHAADVFVLTSRWEAPALSVQEAMRAHLPVVSTAVGGVPDVLGDTGVLVPGGDLEAFAVEVAHLLSDPARALALAESASRRAGSLPDEDDVAVDVLDAYAEACAVRPTGPRRNPVAPAD
ncbi:glycosyltransferase family 4 protein [Jannaschia sp. R86511]|uniref:glycosyltransferase family 4 protein n=1 Tax=Jannaschia sp. R86511 TaxID=3093853 RepID=UPI0036D3A0D7